ncbi:MAG: cell division protein ZapA (FtsZ GTPase activity inhibitor) [Halioglobus sp.]|jgi:cell division protein ZapA (FtsZ GTPase activity inhibitor)
MTEQEKSTTRITVVIAGRSYPVKATEAEARLLPSIEKKINDQIMKIQMSYKDLDMQDYLSMVLLTNIMSSNNAEEQEKEAVSEKLDQLNSLIESVI